MMEIRRAKANDVERLAQLSGELGYPTSTKEMKKRLASLRPASQHLVLVAETREAGVIGWTHISVEPLLEVPLRAEVNGLVVGEDQRSHGAGWKLLQQGEKWAKKQGCRSMSVRSNVIRERAHGFYERNGYEHYKTQKAFRKAL